MIILRGAIFIFAIAACLTALPESLRLNYQNISFTGDNINVAVLYNGLCFRQAQLFTKQDIILGAAVPLRVYNSSTAVIEIPNYFSYSEPMFMKIIALTSLGGDATICSDDVSQNSFYHFAAEMQNQSYYPNDTVNIPVPTNMDCDYPIVQWPRHFRHDGSYCYCYLIEDSFKTCAQACRTNYTLSMSNDSTSNSRSVVFHDLNENAGNFSVNFLCEKDPCRNGSCYMESIVGSCNVYEAGSSEYSAKYELSIMAATFLAALLLVPM